MAEEKTKLDPTKDIVVHVLPKSGGVIVDRSKSAGAAAPLISRPVVTPLTNSKIAEWGTNNLFPQTVLKESRFSPIVTAGIDWKARALYAGGFVTGKVIDVKDDGTEIFKPQKFSDWEKFAQRTNIKAFIFHSIYQFYWFYNVFPEFRLTRDRKQIYSQFSHKATQSRFEQMDDNGIINHCYLQADWATKNESDSSTIKVPVLDPFNDPVEDLRLRDEYRYIFPSTYPSPDESYYALAPWDSLRTSKWLSIATRLANIKDNMMKNAANISFIIEIADWYWTWKYPDFETEVHLQAKRREESYKRFDDIVAGDMNAGKNIFVPCKTNEQTGESFPGWKITPLDRSSVDGKLIEDSTEASLNLCFALGIDASNIGIAPGNKQGAGSGSDKRVAFNSYISMVEAHLDQIFASSYFVRDYNRMDPEMEFRFRKSLILTLDSGKQTQKVD